MRTLYSIIFFLFLGVNLFSQDKIREAPRLLVGIKIDGLQSVHLQKMWKYFTPGGFRKILTEGIVINELQHNIISAGNSADVATIMTGSLPFYHGIGGDYYYSRLDNQTLSILYDKNESGIGTKDKYSAHRLLASTLTDELRMSNPLSQVHSIGINPQDAILMAGHNANSVSWIDDFANRWVTTTYYDHGLSKWADLMNINGSFRKIISEKWTPGAGISSYTNPTVKGSKTVPFSYNPTERREGNSAQTLLKNTPAANTLVLELAKTIFEKEQLGTDKNTDALMLQFNLKIPNQFSSALIFSEQEDMYIRLDRNIQEIISLINSRIGAENVLFFVVGSGVDVHSPVELGKNQIPAGFFNADKALALLNTYLMAVYGQEKWITGYYGKNIFLNRSKIEEKKINWNEFRNRITDFLVEFEGVNAAFTSNEILNFSGEKTDIRSKFRNSYHKNTSGDILISLMPGWIEVDNKGRVVGDANNPQVFVPFFLMGKGIKAQKIHNEHQSYDIAPSLAKLLGIPTPNACVGRMIDQN